MFSDLRFRLRSIARRSVMEQELDSELRFHLDREIEKHVAAGLSRPEAERRARLAFGGLDRIKDDTRDARGVNVVESLMQDLKYALRGLRARPGFASAIILALALGIGANTAMFGVVDRMLFRPPAYLQHPERVGHVFLTDITSGRETTHRDFQYTRYLDFVNAMRDFDRAAVAGYRMLAMGVGEQAKERPVGVVSASFFDFFDARPVVGRFFTVAEDRPPAGAMVAVLSYDFWRSQYGGAATVLGSTIHVGNGVYTVIGVAPPGLVGFTDAQPPVAFIPTTAFAAGRKGYYQNYNWSWLDLYVRRRAGVDQVAADADLTHAYQQSWTREAGMEDLPPAAVARPRAAMASVHAGRAPNAGPESKIAIWVMGVAAIVLLIACANVANLLLARAIGRRREVALRLSLGVSRTRLVQQFALESLVLAVAGGVAGLLVAHWAGAVLNGMFASPGVNPPAVLDGRTLAFTAAATVIVALGTGLAPAVHALGSDLNAALKDGSTGSGSRHSRAGTALMLFQGTLSVVLLVGAGLFLRSLQQLRAMPLGYDADSLVYAAANMRGVKLSDAGQAALDDQMLAAVQHMPGVEDAAIGLSVPFWSFEGRGAPIVQGKDSLARIGHFNFQAATPTYFHTVGTRIVRGRGFLKSDQANSAPIAVVSEAMAHAIWPDEDVIGKQFRLESDTAAPKTIVGVAEDVHAQRLRGDPEFWYYVPLAQSGESAPQLFVRVAGQPADAAGAVRKLLQPLMPGAAYINVTPLSDLVGPSERAWKEGAAMFTAFGALALALAALGLYSVIAYAVAQRTRELGVRIALGAHASSIARMVLGQGLALALIGIAAGSGLALVASHWLEPVLFNESARDPVVFGAVATLLVLVAAAASLIPALRAASVDPARVLRTD